MISAFGTRSANLYEAIVRLKVLLVKVMLPVRSLSPQIFFGWVLLYFIKGAEPLTGKL